ncbi:MAG: glycosyltransferase family 2 protein [Deltaproteobacteria bacterium]|nr:glycosyltransferase family 2 protein [Deltaproteobacteria bacterium]
MPLVSIVVPAYNEAATLPIFHERLVEALEPLKAKVSFELLFINNGSTDGTLAFLEGLRKDDDRIRIVTLSRNFGYQAAITAGLTLARGDAVCCIDSDGEDPPVVMASFIERWLEGGADVVYGVRGKRPESALMQLARKIYYRFTRATADHEIVLDMAEFALLDRRVRDAVLATRSTFPFVRGQVGYVGFRRVGIKYDREARLGGRSHYNLVRAAQFGMGGILSSSTMPLRLLAYGAGVVIPLALAVFLVAGVDAVRTHRVDLVGIAAMVTAILLLWIVMGIGILAMYVARIYKDQVGLPLYVVDRKRSFLGEDHDDGDRTR